MSSSRSHSACLIAMLPTDANITCMSYFDVYIYVHIQNRWLGWTTLCGWHGQENIPKWIGMDRCDIKHRLPFLAAVPLGFESRGFEPRLVYVKYARDISESGYCCSEIRTSVRVCQVCTGHLWVWLVLFRRPKCETSSNWQSSMQTVSGNTSVIPSPKVREVRELAKLYVKRP